jgi:hypothetical protein
MKRILTISSGLFITLMLSVVVLMSCDNESDDSLNLASPNNLSDTLLSQEEKESLLFMLEEEKLARDTYTFLDGLYSVNQFANIKTSEQSHMDAVANLLKAYDLAYTVLPYGEFENAELQTFYDELTAKGAENLNEALIVGATIEDLDIVDLEKYLNTMTNPNIRTVFESLQCGSRNHLRSFVSTLENAGGTYIPQFLSLDEFTGIINDSNERCGQ